MGNPEIKNRFIVDLSGAKYQEPLFLPDSYLLKLQLFLPDLYLLKLQPPDTKLRAWKYLKDGKSPYQNFIYEIGKTYQFDCNKNEQILCAEGCNLATLTWCLKNFSDADEFWEFEVEVKDLIVPYATDGKFRAKKATALRKIDRKEAVGLLLKAMGK